MRAAARPRRWDRLLIGNCAVAVESASADAVRDEILETYARTASREPGLARTLRRAVDAMARLGLEDVFLNGLFWGSRGFTLGL